MSSPHRERGSLSVSAEYPLDTLTDHQQRAFEQFLEARQASLISLQQPISFCRLLVRDKPGMIMAPLVMPSVVEYTPEITIKEVVTAFDLAYCCCENGDLVLARTPWYLDLYTSADDAPGQIGIFLGYPEQDIEHYLSTEPPYTEPADLVAEGVFDPEEVAYTSYVPQRNEDSIRGYERTISEGKEIRRTVTHYAEMWDFPKLAEYAEWLHRRTVADLVR